MADTPKKRQRMIRGPIVLQMYWDDGRALPPVGPFWSHKDAVSARAELRKAHRGHIKLIEMLQVVKLDDAKTWIQ